MSKENNTVETAEEELDAILPEGWSGSDGADIFDPDTWGSDEPDADAQEDDTDEGEGNSAEGDDEQTRTTEEDVEPQTATSEDDNDPTTVIVDEEENKLRFRINADHVEREIALDPADLPTVYQKSLVLDRYQQRVADLEKELSRWDNIAAGLKFENRDALHTSLFEGAVQDFIAEHPSVPEEMARDYITRQFAAAAPAPKQEPAQEAKPAGERDFKQEVAELFRAYPSARTERIPDEVTTDALTMSKPLVQAYADWKARTASAKATRTERENKILKQNQAAAARAPVSKVTGGGITDNKPIDDFLRGFEEDSAWT